LPDPTAAVAHNIVHDQLANYQYLKHRAELRQLLDFALIKARYGDEIDWIEIDRLFSGANMGRILASYRELENRLLTPHAFDDDCGPQPISVASFLRRGSSWQVIRLLAMEYASARHKDPLGVVRLFSISRWFHRIRLIKSGFDSAV
jgi:hypothetical protein